MFFDSMKNFDINCVQFFSFTFLAQFYEFGSSTTITSLVLNQGSLINFLQSWKKISRFLPFGH